MTVTMCGVLCRMKHSFPFLYLLCKLWKTKTTGPILERLAFFKVFTQLPCWSVLVNVYDSPIESS